jgi:hypothetical protein
VNRPFAWSCVAVVAAGFGALAIAWRGTARVVAVGLQVPQLLSGGVAGLGLITLGLLVANVQSSRVASARERAGMGDLADRVTSLAVAAAETRLNPIARQD